MRSLRLVVTRFGVIMGGFRRDQTATYHKFNYDLAVPTAVLDALNIKNLKANGLATYIVFCDLFLWHNSFVKCVLFSFPARTDVHSL